MKVLFREETLNVSFESKFFFFFELKKTFEVLFEEAHHRCSFKELISLFFFVPWHRQYHKKSEYSFSSL